MNDLSHQAAPVPAQVVPAEDPEVHDFVVVFQAPKLAAPRSYLGTEAEACAAARRWLETELDILYVVTEAGELVADRRGGRQ